MSAPPTPELAGAAARRLPLVDVARGVAIAAMVAYHLTWDLWAVDLVRVDLLNDPFWLTARTVIVSAFLFIAGFCDGLRRDHRSIRGAVRRVAVLACAAAAVSVGTRLVFPDNWVFFGILHHLAVATILVALSRGAPTALLAMVGVAVIALGENVALPAFDAPWLAWVGMATKTPDSLDHVPLFPWFGVVLLGVAAGRYVAASPRLSGTLASPPPWNAIGRGLAWAGRWSLLIYLLHQIPLYGAVQAVAWARDAAWDASDTDPAGDERAFMDSCVPSCVNTSAAREGDARAACERMCACALDGFKEEGLWRPLTSATLSPFENRAVEALITTCRAGMWSAPSGN